MNYFIDKNGTRTPASESPNDNFILLPDDDISKQLKCMATSLEAKVKLTKEQAEQAEERRRKS